MLCSYPSCGDPLDAAAITVTRRGRVTGVYCTSLCAALDEARGLNAYPDEEPDPLDDVGLLRYDLAITLGRKRTPRRKTRPAKTPAIA